MSVWIGGQEIGIKQMELRADIEMPAELSIRTGDRAPMPELYNKLALVDLAMIGDSGMREPIGIFKVKTVEAILTHEAQQLYQYQLECQAHTE